MPTSIRAAVLRKPGEPLEITELLLDDPLDHEVVVRTERVGLCHSDLHYVTGALATELPVVLGHEVCGVVRRVGRGVTRVAPGDRVVATVTPACGLCGPCLRGRPTQCGRVDVVRRRPRPKLIEPSGAPVGQLGGIGAFAEAILVGEASLAPVPEALPPATACLLGCAVTTGVGAVVHGAQVGPEDTVAVIGCGGVGIAALQGARLVGARRVVAIDRVPDKLALARKFGATDVVQAADDDLLTHSRLMGLIPGGVTKSVEAVGLRRTAELAFSILAPGGTATVLGLMSAGERMTISAEDLIYGDRVLRGAYMGANRFLSDVEMFVDHYFAERLDLDAMVTAEVPFSDINEGLATMTDPASIRVVLTMTGSRP